MFVDSSPHAFSLKVQEALFQPSHVELSFFSIIWNEVTVAHTTTTRKERVARTSGKNLYGRLTAPSPMLAAWV